ncbi:mitochondrial carrier domain-containing protein [Pelagophyceae sp. CCMP2097]|nr:mitochondrial carrier domain-containing protein [Pelagophyceae sp. CCMP2097]|mmetsp:Transcript_25364/g.87031  ORF Transcript_25364/g.87031 Transcript_25364/m.87031 type:complete len:288 (-) Transcript_25364:1394-2257(-)
MVKDVSTTLVAGCLAGAIECCCTWPMEYLKTQLQSFRKVPGGAPPPFTGIGSGLVYTVRSTGFASLYTGLTPVLIFSVPKAGIRFGGDQYFRQQFKDSKTGKVSMASSFAAGMCAGVSEAIIVVTPQETMKTKLINMNKGMMEGIPLIIKAEGIGGLYSGLISTCMKQGGNQGSRFFFMAQWKQFMTGSSEGKMPKHLTFLGGLGAGLFSVACTSPFDVVKTRLQSTDAKNYTSTLDCFTQIATKEGPLAFFNGAVARCARVVPGQGIIFTSVDVIYDLLEPVMAKK